MEWPSSCQDASSESAFVRVNGLVLSVLCELKMLVIVSILSFGSEDEPKWAILVEKIASLEQED